VGRTSVEKRSEHKNLKRRRGEENEKHIGRKSGGRIGIGKESERRIPS